jgi:formylglycine-generating enzyme
MWPAADQYRAPIGDFPPLWASAWGDDMYGIWADLVVGPVTQRLRWIEPGQFTMGSPAIEGQFIDDKDLQQWPDKREQRAHLVTISRGFWLADTPCTQALWTELMHGRNPSRFADDADAPQRPVDRVSWEAAQGFITRLRAQFSMADASLPTEAQWEYACRAGTQTAFWWGNKADASKANFGNNHRGTTVTGCDLAGGYAPNPFGLYDMHGNVWEWCDDGPHPYQDRPEVDPVGGADVEVKVLRGGSWGRPAGFARAAYRLRALRGLGWVDFGFRLALRSKSPAGGAGGR